MEDAGGYSQDAGRYGEDAAASDGGPDAAASDAGTDAGVADAGSSCKSGADCGACEFCSPYAGLLCRPCGNSCAGDRHYWQSLGCVDGVCEFSEDPQGCPGLEYCRDEGGCW